MSVSSILWGVFCVLLVAAGFYSLLLYLITLPLFQRQLIYLHNIAIPLFPEFDKPAKYGLSARRTFNLKLRASDNVNLGAWLIFPPTTYYSDSGVNNSLTSAVSKTSFQDFINEFGRKSIILCFHGNAGSRATPFRVRLVDEYAARFNAIVLTIDYRGFGDSDGIPSEEGILLDARAAWDFLIAQGSKPDQILLFGHSLGSGVAAALGSWLAKQNIMPRGVVLLSPYSSIENVIEEYSFFGFLPIMAPLRYMPSIKSTMNLLLEHVNKLVSPRTLIEMMFSLLQHRFNTLAILPQIHAPIMLFHALNDPDIPYTHSRQLFNKILENSFPQLEYVLRGSSIKDRNLYRRLLADNYQAQSKSTLRVEEHKEFGNIYEFKRADCDSELIMIETIWGRHDMLGMQGIVMDAIGHVFFIPNGANLSVSG